jgi:two-component system response regulator DesR
MTSVMIVHDSDLLRGALAAVLSHEPDLDVAAQLSTTDDVAAAARTVRPDIVVIYLEQCDEEGLGVLSRIRTASSGSAVLVVTGQHTTDALRCALDAGAQGFLNAETAPEALVAAVRRLADGERMVDPVLLVSALRADDNPLTPRQREVLRLAAAGLSAREIGHRLYLSPGTVRNYLSTAIRRAGGRSLLDAVARAAKEGWL